MAKVTRESNLNKAKLENAVKRGLILSGQLVAQRATGKAPIDTGRLKRSITHGQPFQIGPLSYGIEVGTNVEYAPYQEFGTGDKSERPELSKDPTRPGIPAHPYLRPALQESNDDIKEIIARSIKAAFR